MKTMIMILALAMPLTAQEAKVEEESTGKRVVRTLQDMKWKEFNAAHGRAHIKRGEEHSVRESRGDKRYATHKKQQIKNIVRLAVVGGLAYYIGYHQGEKHFGGIKHRPYIGDRK
jgi:hypothetical protein